MRAKQGPHLSFPFRIDENGRSNVVQSQEQHVKEELLQILLTDPGERFFLPSLGGGVKRLLFEGVTENTFALTKSTIADAISKWLGHRVIVEDLRVDATQEGTNGIEIGISYRLAGSPEVRVLKLQKKGEST